MTIPWLASDSNYFPAPQTALKEPNGLLAAGGDLSPRRLIAAYQQGIFPWYSDNEPILWWSPDPRCILVPHHFKCSRSLKKTIRKRHFEIRINHEFETVIRACGRDRGEEYGTWITEDMVTAYCRLHDLDIAHSVEVWCNNELAGGLYGLALGGVFFGESMFSRATDASKVALFYLAQSLSQSHFSLIDCQLPTSHLESLGALTISRHDYLQMVQQQCQDPHPICWLPELKA